MFTDGEKGEVFEVLGSLASVRRREDEVNGRDGWERRRSWVLGRRGMTVGWDGFEGADGAARGVQNASMLHIDTRKLNSGKVPT